MLQNVKECWKFVAVQVLEMGVADQYFKGRVSRKLSHWGMVRQTILGGNSKFVIVK